MRCSDQSVGSDYARPRLRPEPRLRGSETGKKKRRIGGGEAHPGPSRLLAGLSHNLAVGRIYDLANLEIRTPRVGAPALGCTRATESRTSIENAHHRQKSPGWLLRHYDPVSPGAARGMRQRASIREYH